MDVFEMMCNFLDTPVVIDEIVLDFIENAEVHENINL